MWEAVSDLSRYIATPRVAKHRIYVFIESGTVPDTRLYVVAREDDYFFGVLHSRIHEVWSLATSSRHGDGSEGGRPTYNNTTCFETFPFPWPPGQEDTESAAYQAISTAAKQLHAERDAWLNPPADAQGVGSLRDRTLTNLYNALVELRHMGDAQRDKPDTIKLVAWEFAPRLRELHDALDQAVCDAYGWLYDVLDDEEAILRCLLALNLERAEV